MYTDQDLLQAYDIGYGTSHLTGLQMVAALAVHDALPAPAPITIVEDAPTPPDTVIPDAVGA